MVYIRAQDSRPELIPEGHHQQLLKSIHCTMQAACRWHKTISVGMETNGYLAVNSEKTIFIKCEGKHFIIHDGLFVYDMMHLRLATCNKLKNMVMEKYSKDFNLRIHGDVV